MDHVDHDTIIGWARYLNNERTAEVALLIDGEEIEKTSANMFRADLLTNSIHQKGT